MLPQQHDEHMLLYSIQPQRPFSMTCSLVEGAVDALSVVTVLCLGTPWSAGAPEKESCW